MTFLTHYFAAIDAIAVIALAVFAISSFFRRENIWLGILALAVTLWVAVRLFALI